MNNEDLDERDMDLNERNSRDYRQHMQDQMHMEMHYRHGVGRQGLMGESGANQRREHFEAIVKRPNPEFNKQLIPLLEKLQLIGK